MRVTCRLGGYSNRDAIFGTLSDMDVVDIQCFIHELFARSLKASN